MLKHLSNHSETISETEELGDTLIDDPDLDPLPAAFVGEEFDKIDEDACKTRNA